MALGVAVAVAIALQLVLPARTVPQIRTALVVLVGLLGLSNGWSAVLLVAYLVEGRQSGPGELLTGGAGIWLTWSAS